VLACVYSITWLCQQEALQSAASDDQAISTKLKRQKLLEMFPYVDPTVLVDVFKTSQ